MAALGSWDEEEDEESEAEDRPPAPASESDRNARHFGAQRRVAHVVEDDLTPVAGRRGQAQELELTTLLPSSFPHLSEGLVHDEELGQCLQNAIEELGDENTSAYILFKGRMTKVEQLRPDLFFRLRRHLGVEETYVSDICSCSFNGAPPWVGSSPAWSTSTSKFVLMSLTSKQVIYLGSFIDRYCDFVERHPDTFIGHFVGLYSVALPDFKDGWLHAVAMKNPLPASRKLAYLYDLKGLEKDRFVMRTGVATECLQDANFVREQQVVMLPPFRQQRIVEVLETDARFLRDIRAVGYSLIIGIRRTGADEVSPRHRSSTGALTKVSEDYMTLSGSARSSTGSTSCVPAGGTAGSFEGGHFGWRPNTRAGDAERVQYYFGITDVLNPWSAVVALRYVRRRVRGHRQLQPPSTYMRRFVDFIEDRIVPFSGCGESGEAGDGGQDLHPGRAQLHSHTPVGIADGLSIVAHAQVTDEQSQPTLTELASWHCLIDILEAGEECIRPWVELGLVDGTVLRAAEPFRSDLRKRRLPPNSGPKQQPTGLALAKIGQLVNSVAKAASLKGKLLSNSSSQYSLALAIAVGVEAATLCSAKIRERCSQVFEQHPSLARRQAANSATRRYVLPEEGSWLSPPHMLPDLQFVEHAPEAFRSIRAAAGISDQAYITCVCQREFSFIEFTTNSKSGEFFFFTHDGKCMVKTISPKEANALLRLLEGGFAEHLAAREGSLLTRIYGLYQVQLPWHKRGKSQHFMVQENVLFTSKKVMERFDLKGSTRGRTAKVGESVQKDNDWIDKGYAFGFGRELKEKIRRQHERDCEFLAANQVIDYSLLVGICSQPLSDGQRNLDQEKGTDTLRRAFGSKLRPSNLALDDAHGAPRESITMLVPTRSGESLWSRLREEVRAIGPHGPHLAADQQMYMLGIIDFLIPWTLKKQSEYLLRTLHCWEASAASVAPPQHYARRQIRFVESIL